MRCNNVLVVFIISVLYQLITAEPNGVVLYRNGTRLGHHSVPGTAEHHYFGYLEGPAWENNYSAFRTYIDKDDRNTVDIIGKFKGGAILPHFSDPSVDEHAQWEWGTDILSVGSSMGLGSFRLFSNNTWINPQIPETLDSLVITITDSSVQTPEVQIGYYGWNIGNGNKISAVWTISTTLNERPTHCALTITGDYSGDVVIGLVNHRENNNNPNRTGIELIQEEDPPLLATLGKQGGLSEGFADTLLLAVFTEKSYFKSFVKQGTTNYGMVLKPDAQKTVRWSFAYSWAREEEPLFRKSNWRDILMSSTTIHTAGPVGYQGQEYRISQRIPPAASDVLFTLAGQRIGNRSPGRNSGWTLAPGAVIMTGGNQGNRYITGIHSGRSLRDLFSE